MTVEEPRPEAMGRLDRHLRALASGLLVMCVGLVGTGVVLPDEPVRESLPVPAAAPVKLVVPSIDLAAPVLPIEVDQAGVLHPPDDTEDVGWWRRSAKPGADRGQTVLTGHTVHSGGGVMDELGAVEPGDRIRVRTDEGVFDYEATRVFVYTKAQLARHAATLMGQRRAAPRLVLITCTDFDGRDYQSNIIVLADPVGERTARRGGGTVEAAR